MAAALNAVHVDAIATMLIGTGDTVVPLDRAREDPVYRFHDSSLGPGGIKWLHQSAFTQGKHAAVFAGEPPVAKWIEEAAQPPTQDR